MRFFLEICECELISTDTETGYRRCDCTNYLNRSELSEETVEMVMLMLIAPAIYLSFNEHIFDKSEAYGT